MGNLANGGQVKVSNFCSREEKIKFKISLDYT